MKIGILSRRKELYSTRRLVEACEKRGHEAVVIDHLKCNLIMEQGNPTVYFNGQALNDIDAIVPRVGTSVTFYGSAVVRQFEMMKKITCVSSQGLLRSRDKLRSMQILSRHGLGLPRTVFTNYSRDTKTIIDSVGGPPLIIKLLEGTQGLGVVLAENEKAAKSVIEAFHGLKARIIVQEFVKEAAGVDIRAFVVGGKVVGAMKRQAEEGEFRSNLHRGGKSSVVRLKREEKEAAIKAAKALGLNVAGVDMLQSGRGPLIIEVNSSPGLQGIERATGKDIASSVVEWLESSHAEKSINAKNLG